MSMDIGHREDVDGNVCAPVNRSGYGQKPGCLIRRKEMKFKDEFRRIEQRYYDKAWKEEREGLKETLLSRPIVLYGLGFFGGVLVKNFAAEGMTVQCFCDSNKRGTDTETGLKIVSPQELATQYSHANVMISVANPSTERAVREGIVALGFPEEQIFSFKDGYQFMRQSRVEPVSMTLEKFRTYLDGYERAYDFFEEEESKRIILEIINNYLFNSGFEYDNPKDSYFPPQFVFGEKEVFIDGGLYTGDTTEEFIRRVGGTYSRVIGFDIDKKNLESAYRNLDGVRNVEIIEKGLWNRTESQHAELGIMAGSNIKEDAEDIVELVRLDELFQNVPIENYPTFIKLDIEGSEKQALQGMEMIIKKAKPKLAVCVYHRPEDIYVLPELIKQMNPTYRFLLKHYSPYVWDTVLYAY